MLQQDKYFLFGDKHFTIIAALSWLYRNYWYVYTWFHCEGIYIHRKNLHWLDFLLKTVPYTVVPFTQNMWVKFLINRGNTLPWLIT